MTRTIEQEQKMKQWADTFREGKFAVFKDALDSLEVFYVKHNMPLTVQDCVVGQKAKLTLMIAKEYPRRPMQLCEKCFKTKCDEDSCGAEDYSERYPRSYIGADRTGKIGISVAPFKDKVEHLDEDEIYEIEGSITQFKDRVDINVDTAVKADKLAAVSVKSGTLETTSTDKETVDTVEAAVKICSDTLEMYDGEVPEGKFNKITADLSVSDLQHAMRVLGIKLDGDMYKVKKA